ncbi:MAG: hypothetical protein V7646_3063 [Pseudonocardia sp.]
MPEIGVAAYGGSMTQRGPVRSGPLDEQLCAEIVELRQALHGLTGRLRSAAGAGAG